MPFLTFLSPLNKIALYALICAAIGIFGYYKGVQSERKDWQAAQAQVLEGQLKEIERQKKENAELVAKYQEVEKQRNIYYRKLQDEIAKATDGRVCFANADALSLWNRALTGKSGSMPAAPAGVTKAPAPASVTDRRILDNAIKNFQQYKECRDLHDGLREWRDKNFGSK